MPSSISRTPAAILSRSIVFLTFFAINSSAAGSIRQEFSLSYSGIPNDTKCHSLFQSDPLDLIVLRHHVYDLFTRLCDLYVDVAVRGRNRFDLSLESVAFDIADANADR